MPISDASQHTDAPERADTIEIDGDEIMVAIRKPTQLRKKQPALPRHVVVRENYWRWIGDYESHLRGTDHAANTLIGYSVAFNRFAEFLAGESVSLHIEAIQREHVARWMEHMLVDEHLAPRTVRMRYAALHAFFNWLISIDELDNSPMKRVQKPKIIQKPPQIITDDTLERLLRACRGREFYLRRDAAMVRVMLDTGLRRSGVASMQYPLLDMATATCRIVSKRKTWIVAFSPNTVESLKAYLRAREVFIDARGFDENIQALWLSPYGALNVRSINGVIDRICVRAQIPHLNPHAFRHTWAHVCLANGMQEGDVMELGGWSGTDMIHETYGRSTAHDRAIAAHKRMRLGDRV